MVQPLSGYVQQALSVTPEQRDGARQTRLTQQFLAPALPGLEAMFRRIRAELDPALKAARPEHNGKPYPLGQCLQIAKAVLARLDSLDPGQFEGPAAEACAALLGFRAAGGEVRRVWGDLRGQYFQNAMIVGTLYVDAANDTVVATKPPVEILPFADADLRPIRDYGHFAAIAERYQGLRVFPNHLLPDLAPWLPLVQVHPTGEVRLGPGDRYMACLTLAGHFTPSERALGSPAMPGVLFDALHKVLEGGPAPVAHDAETGRRAALDRCRTARADGLFDSADAFRQAVDQALEVNRRFAGLKAVIRADTRLPDPG